MCWQRGINPTSVEEIHLHCGDSTTLQEGETLCLVNGLYPYCIRFEQDDNSAKKKPLEFFCSKEAPKKTEEDGKAHTIKRLKVSCPSEEEDDDDDSFITEKLRQLQETAAQAAQAQSSPQKPLSKPAPQLCDSWENHGKLLVFTKKGIVPSTKVSLLAYYFEMQLQEYCLFGCGSRKDYFCILSSSLKYKVKIYVTGPELYK